MFMNRMDTIMNTATRTHLSQKTMITSIHITGTSMGPEAIRIRMKSTMIMNTVKSMNTDETSLKSAS